MIHLFNRREILFTYDLDLLYRVKDTLHQNGIRYIVRSNSFNQLGRSHGIPAINHNFNFEYKVYVHRKDFEKAKYILGR